MAVISNQTDSVKMQKVNILHVGMLKTLQLSFHCVKIIDTVTSHKYVN